MGISWLDGLSKAIEWGNYTVFNSFGECDCLGMCERLHIDKLLQSCYDNPVDFLKSQQNPTKRVL